MTLRRLIIGLALLGTLGILGLLLVRKEPLSKSNIQTKINAGADVRSYSFTYSSHSVLHPTLPPTRAPSAPLIVACQSKGFLHLLTPEAGELNVLIEFSEILCGESNVIDERGILRRTRYTREFLTSTESVQRAAQDPALAITRSLFLHLDAGLRPAWPQKTPVLINQELRLEGESSPEVSFQIDAGEVKWIKSFSGPLLAVANSLGLTGAIEYRVEGQSQIEQPIELGLKILKGTEKTSSFQHKLLLAETNLQVTLHRIEAIAPERLHDFLSDSTANAPAAAARVISREEKQALIARWQSFRKGDGQKPAQGESAANQAEYLELKKALRQDPTLARELAPDLKEMDPNSSGFATLAGALVYSGEPTALDAFVEQAGAFPDAAAPMIGLAPRPTDASWQYLDALRKQSKNPDLATAAELGLATHLKRGYQNPAFIDELQQRLSRAKTEDERLHLLDLIGNAGLDQFFSIIDSWISGSSLSLRIRIAQALRFMQQAEAEQRLLSMAEAPELELSLTALRSLQDRAPSVPSIAVFLRILERGPDERQRAQVLENLYHSRQLDPNLLPKMRVIRDKLNLSPSLAQTWDQLEADWVDTKET